MKFKKMGSIVLVFLMIAGVSVGNVSAAKTAMQAVNVAQGKTVTAGIYQINDNPKTRLNDGDEKTGVYYGGDMTDNASGVVSSKEDAWYQIDLGAKYYVESIELCSDNAIAWATSYNFTILASNSSSFADKTVVELKKVGDEGCSLNDNIKTPLKIDGINQFFRYIRLQKNGGSYSQYGYGSYTELKVFADESTKIAPTNVAQGKTVTAGIYQINDNPKTRLNDGDEKTGVYYGGDMTDNASGVVSSNEDAWYQIDLGARYYVENIELCSDNTISWATSYNFTILASNSSNFADKTAVELKKVGDEGCSLNDSTKTPLKIDGINQYFRYIRLQKNGGSYSKYGYGSYTELKVFADTENTQEEPAQKVTITSVSGKVSGTKFIVNIPYSATELSIPKKVTAYVAITDKDGKMIKLSLIEKTIESKQSSSMGGIIDIPQGATNYIIYVWEDMQPLTGRNQF